MKEKEFYKSRNSTIDNIYSVCKNCACRVGNHSIDDFHKILMILDIPFIPELYKACESSENITSDYMLRINNPNKKDENGKKISEMVYADSPTLEMVTDVDSYIYSSDNKMSELYSLFGDKWNKTALISMNKELDDMIVQYGGSREEMATVDLYCELIRLKWLSREQMDNGNIKDGKALITERNKMLKENNMTVQALREKNTNESFGSEIDYAETRPIKPKKKYFDYSGLMYMFKYFVSHQERFNKDNNKPIDDDYTEMTKYKELHKKEYKAEMFADDYDFSGNENEEDIEE